MFECAPEYRFRGPCISWVRCHRLGLAYAGPRGRVLGVMLRGETRHRPLMCLLSRSESSLDVPCARSGSLEPRRSPSWSSHNPSTYRAAAATSTPSTPLACRVPESRRVCLTRLRCVLEVSHLLDASFRSLLVRPCFMPVPSMGFHPFEGFSPSVAPGASRLAVSSVSLRRSRVADFEDFGIGRMR